MHYATRLVGMGTIAAYALAFSITVHAESRSKKKGDPNEMVCEKQEVLGSRLAVKRVCMTRAQWAERRQLDREVVQRTQTGLCVPKGGVCMRE